MKGKNGVKLADFIREIINTKISEKPVKSRIFENFEGIRENKKSPSETPPKRKVGGSNPFWRATSNAESLCFQGLSVFIFVKNEKNENPQFFIGFLRLLTEFMTDVVRLSGGFFYVIRCVFL